MSVLKNGEIVLYGFVGDSFFDDGFTAAEVLDALADLGRDSDIVVRINSGGGYVDDGIAIYNALVAHRGKVAVHVDALAASSASIIAMAGDERIMRAGAMMMIHDPSTITFGTAADHERSKKQLDKYAGQVASIYAEVTGDDADAIREEMIEELWLTGEEAVERGFATSVATRRSTALAAFDFSAYEQPPERLVALAKKKNWSFASRGSSRSKTAASAASTRHKETDMSDKKTAEQEAAETTAAARTEAAQEAKARIKAIMASEEAKGREALAEHFAYDTEMSAADAKAALAKAPAASAPAAEGDESTEGDGAGAADPKAYEERRLKASGQAAPEPARREKARSALNPQAVYANRRKSLKEA